MNQAMNQQTYALSGIEKFKQRMQRGNAAAQPLQTQRVQGTAAAEKLRRSATPDSQMKPSLNEPSSKYPSGKSRGASHKRGTMQKEAKPHDQKRPPKFLQKLDLDQIMGGGASKVEQDLWNQSKPENQDKAKAGSAKQTPTTATLDKMISHHGSTASFAIKETFDRIQAKLDSAQRKEDQFNFGRPKRAGEDGDLAMPGKTKKNVKDFGLENEVQEEFEEEDDEEEDHEGMRKAQGTASRRSLRSCRRGTPMADLNEYASGEDEDDHAEGSALDQTPPPFNESTQRSKKTRMGSADEQGNRLSNMPGEERPSLASVTPYDDHPDHLITKVEKIITQAQQEKEKIRQRPKATAARKERAAQQHENHLALLESKQEKLMQSKRVLQNEGQQFERKNFVRINQNKMAKYKPALRGAAFQNKIMAKKTNVMKFRRRQQAKIMAERNENALSAYGGLGAHGLDFGEAGCPGGGATKQKELDGSFSRTAMQYATVQAHNSEEDDLLVGGDIQDEVEAELEKVDQVVPELDTDTQDDQAAHAIPETDEGYLKVLHDEFGHTEFREGQLKAIKIILEEKRNTLVVLATGGGKSLCYQFACRFLPGLVLVVTPLISLMTDQLQKLPDFIPGAALNSQQQFSTKQDVVKAVQQKKIKVLFITPERLFMEDLSKFGRQIAMVCVDEIHCASEWSHNFRPAYLVLHDMIKEKLGDQARVIGLTATATRAAQEQICHIFDIKYPEHIVSQVCLSRMNLQLSITRDSEKQTALLTLLRSPSYVQRRSILIFATQRRTTDLLAAVLNQNGFKASSYHAGKTDDQRAKIQADFIANRTRVLCCTIAFSMGIDKSDIESVIHYDIPRSLENYVQEIGRAGRDGKLARCHMFLRDEDFYQLRRITLSDLLDNQSALQLTNKIILEAKKKFHKLLFADQEEANAPQVKAQTRKRKRAEVSGGLDSDEDQAEEKIMEDFKQEDDLKQYYEERAGFSAIDVAEHLQGEDDEDEQKLYVALNVKSLLTSLDLKKEVVLTMLNQLEKIKTEKSFMRIDSILPVGVQLRFFKKQLDELAELESEKPQQERIYSCFQRLATSRDGVHRCNLLDLAKELRVKPYSIPKMLYRLQHGTKDDIAYDLDRESFVIVFTRIPSAQHVFELTEDMLAETRKVEKNLVAKLNCMYFAARKVSAPSVDYMMRMEKESELPAKEDGADGPGERAFQMHLDCSKRLNDLINAYFSSGKEDDVELKIAGNADDRALMMPLLYIDGEPEAKEQISEHISRILSEFHRGEKASMILNPINRMKPLDVVKVLMGINSSRESVRRFQYSHALWAKCHEYDYEQMLQLSEECTQNFYCQALAMSAQPIKSCKKLKVEEPIRANDDADPELEMES